MRWFENGERKGIGLGFNGHGAAREGDVTRWPEVTFRGKEDVTILRNEEVRFFLVDDTVFGRVLVLAGFFFRLCSITSVYRFSIYCAQAAVSL